MASGTGFRIPNETGNALSSNRQAEHDEKDFEIMRDVAVQIGVYSGCAVTAKSPTPDMSVDVAAGVCIYQGNAVTVTGGNVSVGASGGTPRFDLVAINATNGALVVIAGAGATDPVFPAYVADRIILAAVYVPASDTDIDADQIVDKRMFIRSLNISGTIGARPAAAIFGRYFYATDNKKTYFDTGTAWELIGPTNVYDTFNRSNGSLGTTDSGHTWTTDGLQISSNAVKFLSGNGQATLDLGHPIDRATFKATIFAGTGGTLDAAIMIKHQDFNDFLMVQIFESDTLSVKKVVSGTPTNITSSTITILDSNLYQVWVELDGSFINVKVYNGLALVANLPFGSKTQFYDPYTTNTKVGIRLLAPANAEIRDFVVNCDR